jgi:hypothetical protein
MPQSGAMTRVFATRACIGVTELTQRRSRMAAFPFRFTRRARSALAF